MRALITSHYPNPKPKLIECAKNYSDIKTLKVIPRALRVSEK